jgi:trehalose 6-phosphate phosphatase
VVRAAGNHAALGALLGAPDKAGVFTDFDGTLSPIVEDPGAARPLPGAPEVLTALAGRYARVGVISGRPLAFLRGVFGDELFLAGLYGLEVLDGGQEREHPNALRWRAVVDEVVGRAGTDGPAGARVEHKGLSLTLHYRGRSALQGAVEAFAAFEAARTGLEARPAKASVELHPPLPADKGTALTAAAEGLAAACFVGDDVGDLTAFDALERLADRGVATVRIGVRSPEAPPRLLQRADLVVDGPEGVLALLRRLAEA